MRRLPWFLLSFWILPILAGCQHRGSADDQAQALRHWESRAASEDPAQRRAAAEALGKMSPHGLDVLVKLLRDPDRCVRAAATVATMKLGPNAVPWLQDLLRSSANKQVRTGAAQAFTRLAIGMRVDGAPYLVNLLNDPEPEVRGEAAKALLRADPALAREALPALKGLLADENPGVRAAAATTLKILEPRQKPSESASPQTPQTPAE
jgi:HEAT repeat protein